LIFATFGDRVQNYLTINEPGALCGRSYGLLDPGDVWIWPPGMMISKQAKYDCAHMVNLAHGSIVKMARTKYASQKFKFGMPLIIELGVPVNPNSKADVDLAQTSTVAQSDWHWGRIIEMLIEAPMISGDYPAYLRTLDGSPEWNYFDGSKLPIFTDEEKEQMKGMIEKFLYKVPLIF
jgi:beta-glucosidase/6-phospho-beta-glucosidase/beta-galactosidase